MNLGRNRPRHTGLTDRIRETVARGPTTVNGIAEHLGEQPDKVKRAIAHLCDRLGGVAAVPWSSKKLRLYATPEWISTEERKRSTVERSSNVAGKIEIGRGFRWGAGL